MYPHTNKRYVVKSRINIYNYLPMSLKYSLSYDCDIKSKLCLKKILEMNIIILLDVITFTRKTIVSIKILCTTFIQLMQTENSKNRVNLARFITIILNEQKLT